MFDARVLSLLFSSAFPFMPGAVDGHLLINGCSAVSNADAAKVLRVDVGTIRMESSTPEEGHTRCVYKSMEKVVGATDALAGELDIDAYRLASAERAQKQLADRGNPDLLVKTADGPDVDDAAILSEQVESDINREPGFVVRHDRNVVAVEMPGSFMQERPAGWSYSMQALGLAGAGAHVLGPLFPDACDVVPRRQLQTLITLQPAVLTPDATGSMSSCKLTAEIGGSSSGSVSIRVEHYASEDDIHSARQYGSLGTLAHGIDPEDFVMVPDGVRGKATGVHDDTIASIEVNDPDANAFVSPSYFYRVQRAALQAAGATVQPAPQFGEEPAALSPQAPAPPAAPSALGSFLQSIEGMDFFTLLPILIPVLLLGGYVRRSMRRKRLLSQGILAKARITAVRDTGTTVNNRPLVRYDVIITTATAGEYRASTTKLTNRLISPASLIGTSQPVRYDANNPQSFIFINDF